MVRNNKTAAVSDIFTGQKYKEDHWAEFRQVHLNYLKLGYEKFEIQMAHMNSSPYRA